MNCFSVASDFQVASLPVQLDLTSSPPVLRDCVRFTVTDDLLFELPEVFDVELTTPTNFAMVIPDSSMAEVLILDNDDGELSHTHLSLSLSPSLPPSLPPSLCQYLSCSLLQRFWLCIYLLVTLSMKTMELLRFVLL